MEAAVSTARYARARHSGIAAHQATSAATIQHTVIQVQAVNQALGTALAIARCRATEPVDRMRRFAWGAHFVHAAHEATSVVPIQLTVAQAQAVSLASGPVTLGPLASALMAPAARIASRAKAQNSKAAALSVAIVVPIRHTVNRDVKPPVEPVTLVPVLSPPMDLVVRRIARPA